MRKFSYLYGLNIRYEINTYKYVGHDYPNQPFLKKYRIVRLIKRIMKKYTVCNNYTEWEKHVQNAINKDIINPKDFIRWLYRKKDIEEQFLEAIKSILIPIYIAIFPLMDYFGKIPEKDVEGFILFGLILIVSISSKYLYDTFEKVNFYRDFIEIAEKYLLGTKED
ncbi:MAG: hypothetical protein J1E61_05605 [Lachnospiraceae bacterium]|nr:hypothetical protein [Lachnospiraceae bacterium]